MKVLKFIALILGSAAVAAGAAMADEPVGYVQGSKLLTKYNCQTCHALDKDQGGPSLRSIAKKYAGSPSALTELEAKVLNGSSGETNGPNPMPATAVPDADLKPLMEWILSLGPT